MAIRVFISHSSLDKPIAHALSDLLRSSLDLPKAEIRCTSVEGHRLHGGADTAKELRKEITEAPAFIGLVSTSSLESAYVLFEMGARWGADMHMIPLLVPGASATDLRGPLTGMTAHSCDSEHQLHQLVDELRGHLGIQPVSPAAYLDELRKVMTATPDAASVPQPAKALPTPPSIDPQAAFEAEVSRLERLLTPLPPAHLNLLKKFAKGPQVVRRSEERNSLSDLNLIRYVSSVSSQETLWEASSEETLREYFARRRRAELPQLVDALSPEEKAFLRLFFVPEVSSPGGFSRENPLSHSVYVTRWSLCQNELLRSRPSPEEATEIYALADDAVGLLEANLGCPVARTELVVDLNAVLAPDSSGGGA